jgi:hypothetical protein
MPGHPAVRIGARHKARFEAWLADRIESGGIANSRELARQIAILMDGAFSSMLVHRNPEYMEAAGRAARALLVAARAA